MSTGADATTAQGPVEARSLSAVTAIASHPPAYPRNPTQKKLDPLVLYIVRVPGSKGKLNRSEISCDISMLEMS